MAMFIKFKKNNITYNITSISLSKFFKYTI